MSNELTIKTFDVDYSFLIKNYLDISLWSKKWTLFQYKNIKIELNIGDIWTQTYKLGFDITGTYTNLKTQHSQSVYTSTYTSLNLDDISFVKRQINTAIFSVLKSLEECCFIKTSDRYCELVDLKYEEWQKLKNVARDFIKNNNFSSDEDVQDAFVDTVCNKLAKVPDLISEYCDQQLYKHIPDVYLAFLNVTEYDPKTKYRLEEVKNAISEPTFTELMEQIEQAQKDICSETYAENIYNKIEEDNLDE